MNRKKRSQQQKNEKKMKIMSVILTAILLAAAAWSVSGWILSSNTLRRWDASVLLSYEGKCIDFRKVHMGRNTRCVFTLDNDTQLCIPSEYLSEAELDGQRLEAEELEFVYTKQSFRLTGDLLLVEIRQNGKTLFPESLGRAFVQDEVRVYGLLSTLVLIPCGLLTVLFVLGTKSFRIFLKRQRKNERSMKQAERRKQLEEMLLPYGASISFFEYNEKCFGNMVLDVQYHGRKYRFVNDRGEISVNQTCLETVQEACDPFSVFMKCVEDCLFGEEQA